MQLYRDDGIVLRTQKLGEADRIITVLGRGGRVRAVAKGVRRTKSRFGARLEPFTHVDLMLHAGRSLDIITQAEVIRPYGAPLAADYPRYTAGVAMLETAERFTPVEKEPALRQLLLLIGGLRALGDGEHEPRLVLDAFLLRSLAVAGYAPALQECARCGAPRERRPWTRQAAAGLRGGGRGHGMRLLPSARRGLARGADGGADARPAPRRLGQRRSQRTQAPGRVQRPGGRLSSVASGAFDPFAASCGACLMGRPGVRPPDPHPSGVKPPAIPREFVPRHVALVMDGDGRWAYKTRAAQDRGP